MVNEKQIKIIKRAEQHHDTQTALSERSKSSVQRSDEMAKRDAVTVVTEWIREWRQKKAAEATRGFESLFDKAA